MLQVIGKIDRLRALFARRVARGLHHGFFPGSIWGVDQSYPAPLFLTFGSNVALTAGIETTIVASAAALAGTPGMNYIPVMMGVIPCTQGATPPTALTFAARYATIADFATQVIAVATLTASVTVNIPLFLVGANVRANAAGQLNANVLQVTGLAATTANTAVAIGSSVMVLLLAGPDL